MITFRHKGDFSKATQYFEKLQHIEKLNVLNKYGQQGVSALKSATPVESGLTASSWYYEIKSDKNSVVIFRGRRCC